ncbi:MAG: glycine--tRNA ligase subunit beta [Rhodocyclaceae bacterium]|nr:glycine--tRNA ligase subunit beta [Rhodocyclaceae bacterium]
MRETLLIELLTEELPPKSLAKLGMAFREQMQKSLADGGFIDSNNAGKWFATPRRLALQFVDCLSIQPDRTIEKKGPSVAAGLVNSPVGAGDTPLGMPTKALEGFMRSAGVTFDQLERASDGKAEYFLVRQHKSGEPLAVHLSEMIEAALKKLPIAKFMRWGNNDSQFVRPVHGLILMHGANVMAGKVLGLESGNITRGHRFMSAGDIAISYADQYAEALAQRGKVVADFATRRAMIVTQLTEAAAKLKLQFLQDEALVDEVTALVEHPAVYAAQFDAEFLTVPPECLILTMKANQKYFPLLDNGKLTNRFLIVSNMQVADPVNIVEGNARVVRPRLADAKFFFETDKKTSLASRVDKLDRIVYHNKLGTQGARVKRLVTLTGKIATLLGAEVAQAERAALLCKADLVTDMVGEFPELQGIMGRYYALADGENTVVAEAIKDHYHPRGAGDTLPVGNVACAVALAERLDSLAGMFCIGQIPTGDKDPFALRRAALGVLRILIEHRLPIDLNDLVNAAVALQSAQSANAGTDILIFIFDRLRAYLRDSGFSPSETEAVVSLNSYRMDLVFEQLSAIRSFMQLPEAEALTSANKRVANILRKAEEAGESFANSDASLLCESAELELHAALSAAKPIAEAHFAAGDYSAYLKTFAVLKEPVDKFFKDVMVMTDNAPLRSARLALLQNLQTAMNRVGALSKLAS